MRGLGKATWTDFGEPEPENDLLFIVFCGGSIAYSAKAHGLAADPLLLSAVLTSGPHRLFALAFRPGEYLFYWFILQCNAAHFVSVSFLMQRRLSTRSERLNSIHEFRWPTKASFRIFRDAQRIGDRKPLLHQSSGVTLGRLDFGCTSDVLN